MPVPIRQKNFSSIIRKDMPNPTKEDLESPEFNAIWNVIKKWDVNVPEYYSGYCGANGSHVKLILDELRIVLRDTRIDSIIND